jgi:hypothetical protein
MKNLLTKHHRGPEIVRAYNIPLIIFGSIAGLIFMLSFIPPAIYLFQPV